MAVHELNYWLTTVEMPTPPAQPLPETADVAVIGAGYTGLSAALALAKRGARVVVLESQTIGWGASSRNGGMVLTGMKLGVNKLISMYGRELTRRMYAASLETIDAVERIVKAESIACDFARTGHLEVACKQAHFDDYARQVEVIAREFTHQLRVVPRGDLRSEIGSDIYYGGMVDEISVGVNPARYVAGLGTAAMRAGAHVAERTKPSGRATFSSAPAATQAGPRRHCRRRSSRSGPSLSQPKSCRKPWRANSARATARSTTRKTIFITIG